MGVLDGEIWVCAECRSINNARAKQCYNCRTPRDRAAVDPATIEGTGRGKLRDVALPPFHSPRPYAAIASILILATAAIHVLYTLNFTILGNQVLGGTAATAVQNQFLSTMEIASFAVAAAALVGWSLWLSRAVVAMPALGLGYPAANGLMAFVENFLPGLNLLRVPAIVRDVVRRVEPGQNRGEALIFAAWIGLLGGFVVPRVGAFVSGMSADSPEALLRSLLPILGVSAGLVLVGAIFLVALIWWIEERIVRRREAQLAAIDAATAGATEEIAETTEEEVTVPHTAQEAPTQAPPATPSPWSWRETTDSPLAAPAEQTTSLAEIARGAGWENEFAVAAAPAASPRGADPVSQPVRAPEQAPPPPPEPVEAAIPIETSAPIETPAPIERPAPEPEPAPETEPARADAAPAEPAHVATADEGPPHLTIRVANRGMLQAEMGGEIEPVILEDLTAYGHALADARGTAEIVLAGNDGMVQLIARRAQRILADAGIDAPIPD